MNFYHICVKTTKKQVALLLQRGRAVLCVCPSVVSLNKITREDSFIIVTYASDLPLRNVVFGVTLRLLVIHFVVVSRHQQTRPLTSD